MRRGKPLERGGSQPQRSAPLKRGDSELKRTPLRQRSDKRASFMRDTRAPEVARMAAAGDPCRVGLMLAREDVEHRCAGVVQGIHERRKRSAGGSLVNRANLVPCCNWCNGWIEDEPALARELFGCLLVVREGDLEWDLLGARLDGRS